MADLVLIDALVAVPRSADDGLIDLWLRTRRSDHTRRAYRADVARFQAFAGVPISRVSLDDLQAFADELDLHALAPATRARMLSAVKSLLAFGAKTGLLAVDVGRALPLPGLKNTLAERLLSEDDVGRLLATPKAGRDRALLQLLFRAGLRVSEAVGLRWRDLRPRRDGGQVNVFGKGAKTRTILLPGPTYAELVALRRLTDVAGDPVFRSRTLGGALSAHQAWRIVKDAAASAGLDRAISPHWLRHAHATIALEHGAPLPLVKETLGHASIETTGKYLHARPNTSSGLFLPEL